MFTWKFGISGRKKSGKVKLSLTAIYGCNHFDGTESQEPRKTRPILATLGKRVRSQRVVTLKARKSK